MFASSLSVGLALLPFVVAKSFDVEVGGPNGSLTFAPQAVAAAVGDTVVFHFNPKNHSVFQSSFNDPCGPKEGGFRSDFMFVAANTSSDQRPTFSVKVNDTDPVWIYCAQAANTPASHCGQGMIFSINCPSDDSPNSLGNFKKEALAIGASLSAAAAATAVATSGGGGYGGGYGGAPPAQASSTLTAANGGVTNPPAVSETVVTSAITMGSSSWTTVYTSFVNSPAATPAAPGGTTHTVTVGGTSPSGTPQLLFSPTNLDNVAAKDTIVFQFQQKNHSVIQSSFADPCSQLNLGNASAPQSFNSGYHPVSPNSTDFPTWSITVNDTAPIWAYCGQTTPTSHCGAGMVFAINAVENSTHSYDAFVAAAKQLNGTAAASASAGSPSNTGGALSLRGSSGVFLALVAVVASLL